MAKNLIIRDYRGRAYETGFDMSNLKHVLHATIDIISGDEILSVILDDGSIQKWDSCPGMRIHGFYDGTYDVYWPKKNINFLVDDDWLRLTDSYDRQFYAFSQLVENNQDQES